MEQKVLFRAGRNCIFGLSGFIQGCRTQGESRFHLFVSDVNQGNKEAGWVQDFLALNL